MALRLQKVGAQDMPVMYALLVLCGEHMHRTLGLSHWYPFRPYEIFQQQVDVNRLYAIYSDEYLGGIRDGHYLKAVVAGGSSVPILPANLILKTQQGESRLMSYESLSDGGFQSGTMLGSGGFIAMDETTCIVRNTWNFSRFYRHESCGQCSPCREGTGWMEKVLYRIEHGMGHERDIDLLVDVAKKIEGNTICPLGDAAAWPVGSAIRHFRDEFEWHVKHPSAATGKGAVFMADENLLV